MNALACRNVVVAMIQEDTGRAPGTEAVIKTYGTRDTTLSGKRIQGASAQARASAVVSAAQGNAMYSVFSYNVFADAVQHVLPLD